MPTDPNDEADEEEEETRFLLDDYESSDENTSALNASKTDGLSAKTRELMQKYVWVFLDLAVCRLTSEETGHVC